MVWLRVMTKGIALGAVMFFVFSMIYLWACGMIPSFTKQIGVDAIKGVITHNALYWTAGVLMLALGCVIIAIWPVKVAP